MTFDVDRIRSVSTHRCDAIEYSTVMINRMSKIAVRIIASRDMKQFYHGIVIANLNLILECCSNEKQVTCESNKFQCLDGQCIDSNRVCNGHKVHNILLNTTCLI